MTNDHQQDNIQRFETLELTLTELRDENLRLSNLINSARISILDVVDTKIGDVAGKKIRTWTIQWKGTSSNRIL